MAYTSPYSSLVRHNLIDNVVRSKTNQKLLTGADGHNGSLRFCPPDKDHRAPLVRNVHSIKDPPRLGPVTRSLITLQDSGSVQRCLQCRGGVAVSTCRAVAEWVGVSFGRSLAVEESGECPVHPGEMDYQFPLHIGARRGCGPLVGGESVHQNTYRLQGTAGV
jgi:hypothetical protein